MLPLRISQKIIIEGSCWNWIGFIHPRGYGTCWNGARMAQAHRVVYEYIRGLIPPNITLDHLCRNRRCVNPDHLEPVTNKENILRGVGLAAQNARKTHCKRGHLFDEQNTFLYRGKVRVCRACHNLYTNKRYHEKRAFVINASLVGMK